MASACVNNIGVLSENFSSSYSPSFGWFSPRVSFSHEIPKEEEGLKIETSIENPIEGTSKGLEGLEDLINLSGGNDFGDFEFRLDYPVPMLAADELFSDGKLIIPSVQIAPIRPSVGLSSREEMRESFGRSVSDPYLFSPKAPRCSSRWKELLGLKKVQTPSVHQKPGSNSGSLKHFLHRNPKSSSSSLSLPLLLRDTDLESTVSMSSSSSSSDDVPKDRIPPPRVRLVKPTPMPAPIPLRPVSENSRVGRSPMRNNRVPPDSNARGGVTIDSPRMNSSGKVVFQSLERSSSSPSTFNGGPRVKHKGMERSYSANVRVTPVLNVGVCSLRGSKSGSVFGFGQLFSASQKKDGASSSVRSSTNSSRNHRSDRV
ncbi:hypothetical protein GIB67_000008 [Kingdonia uniflora]|uniref:Uncharacterized protein n=1 Tax=Kingdonia uniflora TaxID=39325 RepID=A0A7J7MNS0_9MAGN|nr:hypothetical protein GIB67_000008 [Kingdonia uniflora]